MHLYKVDQLNSALNHLLASNHYTCSLIITLNFDATSEPANPKTPLVIDFVINGLFLRQVLYSEAISDIKPFLDKLMLLKKM